MTLEILQKEMTAAMKAKDNLRKEVIAGLITAVKYVAISKKCKDNITEALVDEALLKELSAAEDSVTTCPPERTELLEKYTKSLEIVKEYAPVLMSEAEIRSYIESELIELTSANVTISPKIKGMLMKNIMPHLKGKADGNLVNKIVTELLSI